MLAAATGRPAPLAAQRPSAESGLPAARAVVERFLEAANAARWTAAAEELDLTLFAAYRQVTVASARLPRLPIAAAPTPAELQREDSTLSLAVAEYLAARERDVRAAMAEERPDRRLRHEWAHIDSVAQLERMPVAQAAARWLEARSLPYRVQVWLSTDPSTDCRDERTAQLRETLSLRALAITDSVAYALVSRAMSPTVPSPPRVLDDERLRTDAQLPLRVLREAQTWEQPAPDVLLLRLDGQRWRVVGPVQSAAGAFVLSALCQRSRDG